MSNLTPQDEPRIAQAIEHYLAGCEKWAWSSTIGLQALGAIGAPRLSDRFLSFDQADMRRAMKVLKAMVDDGRVVKRGKGAHTEYALLAVAEAWQRTDEEYNHRVRGLVNVLREAGVSFRVYPRGKDGWERLYIDLTQAELLDLIEKLDEARTTVHLGEMS